MSTPSHPDDSLLPYLELAQRIRNAAANKDYPTLGPLLVDHLDPSVVDMMTYIRSERGHLSDGAC
jgi:hypothetical protein